MKRSRYISLGGICIGLAVLFQVIPAFFSELFVFITVLSTIPIYIISRISPKLGIGALIIAGLITMTISVHEGIFFFFTNGTVGLALGAGKYYFDDKRIVSLLSGIYLTITLCIINYLLNISVFGTPIQGNIFVQVLIIFTFAVVYSFMYLNLLMHIFTMIPGVNDIE